jgi:predicted amidophosphoribosyltransferase
MQVALRQVFGPWDQGWVLAKHMLSSTFLGNDQYGHARFDNVRSEVGEATYQLKYRQDWGQVEPLAATLVEQVYSRFDDVGFIVPMPASTVRARQPVTEVALAVGRLVGKPVFTGLLLKQAGQSLKDLHGKDDKLAALKDRMRVVNEIGNEGKWNAMLVDDLYDSGASMEAACAALRTYPKVGRIYVAALTWK